MKIINLEHTTWEAERGNHKFKACLECTELRYSLGNIMRPYSKTKIKKKTKKPTGLGM